MVSGVKRRIIFTVTNDLNFDQRMQRICHSLACAGFHVTLLGRSLPHSLPLSEKTYQQHRLHCIAQKGFAFYAEYNLRLLIYLLTARFDAICSVDLDTISAGFLASLIRNKKRVFDAHEYFTEVPEVCDRPIVKGFWSFVGRISVPFYKHAYTVGPALAALFTRKYGVHFQVVRNCNKREPLRSNAESKRPNILLYQGALNEGRGIEQLLDALFYLPDVVLYLAGEGDLSTALRARVKALDLEQQVHFLGMLEPEALKRQTQTADIGLNLLENRGLSYYYSLANKFFDFVQAELPIVTMNFPEYAALNRVHEVAILLDDLNPLKIADAIRTLIDDSSAYKRLRENCKEAKQHWNWEAEEKQLIAIWESAFEGKTM